MRKALYFDPATETRKAYLTRAAQLLDILRDHPELISTHPALEGMAASEIREFESYLCRIICSDVKKAAGVAAKRANILEYKDVIANIALSSVMEIFHTYNSSARVSVAGGHGFDTFISNIIKNSVREAFIEKTGLKKHQLDKANRVRKAIHYVSVTENKIPEEVTVNEIFAAQTKISLAAPLSINTIKEVIEYMETMIYYDGLEDFEVENKFDPMTDIENEETKAALHKMFSTMKKAQRYVFLKRFLTDEDGATYKQLAKEEKLIELCMDDTVCKRNLTRGDLQISRPKGNALQKEEVYHDIMHVKIDFLDYLYRDAVKRFRSFIADNGLTMSDMEGWLNDWIYEEIASL